MELTVGVWRLVSKLRTKIYKQASELRDELDKSDDNDILRLTAIFDSNRDDIFVDKLAIVALVDGIEDTENLNVAYVAIRYDEIETEIINKMLNRSKELPN